MHTVSYLQGVNEALTEEMERDERVFVMGEDVTWNLMGASAGLLDKFGPRRVRDTPISEAGFVGAGAGAAMVGMRPVIDMLSAPFLYVAFDQIVSIIAKSTYLYGGQAKLPITVRAPMMYAGGQAAQHSDRPYATLMTIPGLKIIVPTNPYDVKGLLKAAIRDDDPVIVFEDNQVWRSRCEIPDDDYVVPLGKGLIKREGLDVTIVAVAGSVPHAVLAAEQLEKDGISAEVIDLRSIVPMDYELIFGSVNKTGRLVVADPAHRMGSVASEIAAVVVQECFSSLRSPILRVTAPHCHVPFSVELERQFYPTALKIENAAKAVMK